MRASCNAPNQPGIESNVFFRDDLVNVAPIVTRSAMPGYKLSEFHPLAADRVRFVGEPVAMCVAASRAAAEDLTELVEVDYAELPAIASSAAGRASGAVRLHEHWSDNLFLETSFDSGIDSVAASAPVKIDLTLSCARQVMHPMEGRGLLCWWDHRAAQLVVHASTQVPHLIRAGLAEVLNIPQAALRIAPPDIGGGFGYKCLLQPEDVCVAWLALTRKTPFRSRECGTHGIGVAFTAELISFARKRGRRSEFRSLSGNACVFSPFPVAWRL